MERRSLIPSEAEFANWRREIDKGIKRSVRIGRVNLVITSWPKPAIIALRIMQNREGANCHFIEAVPRTAITIPEIDEPDKPWEMVVECKELTLEQVAKELPTFLYFFYPQANELPIHIYRSLKDFQKGNPIVISEFENDLVTVKTAA
ncbi:hypothetical protein A2W70_01860 [Candidatus Curtissbacteria bacterium RIFCSPLOWO2_02_41_11]|uniref:Uncharacterized protein n=2 Tax=Candidatus Curtissiibacteriota TaxID=1752717 RepID=A0A1F5HSU8_9BACT|nr:MAG: hypothetical protein UU56_C0012G0037 [Candidatus Curtissbacteria bacterium GW2011_GWA2_41_24]OGD89549.1 MAG: hypothetical protein A2Z54_03385 [Candidatus Curtissbacteria bacterium RIFCSPHIGHO2_02_39_8]OGE07163.1 MAG: hypothetical protein A2W70_01860 [Candidatus Curtissbacteria bacterium RIFCSPLOWO2_02_41_11]